MKLMHAHKFMWPMRKGNMIAFLYSGQHGGGEGGGGRQDVAPPFPTALERWGNDVSNVRMQKLGQYAPILLKLYDGMNSIPFPPEAEPRSTLHPKT